MEKKRIAIQMDEQTTRLIKARAALMGITRDELVEKMAEMYFAALESDKANDNPKSN